jgi:hypothetical protein
MTEGPPQTASQSAAVLVTNAILAITGAVVLAMVAPMPLAALGVISQDALQGLMTLTALGLALPAIALVLAAAVLSIIGLARGPGILRVRLAAWWTIGVGGLALSAVTAPSVGFNPYLGIPQPGFGASDAFLVAGLGLSILLPCRWFILTLLPRRPDQQSTPEIRRR